MYQMIYDNQGRLLTKTGTDGTTSYTYNNSGNGIEQVQTITGPNGITQSYTYDNYGRVTQSTENIPGEQSLATGFGYDSWGNNTSITYPSGIVITNLFNSDGYLNEIKNSESTIWKLDNLNSTGQPVQYSLGNSGLKTNFEYDTKGFVSKITTGIGVQSYTFEPTTGNLTNRTYKKSNESTTLSETFSNDGMDRLTNIGQTSSYVTYSANGNITHKSDAGGYVYDQTKTNAVTQILNNPGTIPSTLDSIAYTDFNMTSSVTEAPYEIQYTYGPGNQRIKSVLKNNGSTIETKYYSIGYEKEITGSTEREIHYISSPFGLVAVLIKQGGTTTTYYAETDHLGSIIALLNPDESYSEQYSYDACLPVRSEAKAGGRRRNPGSNIKIHLVLEPGSTIYPLLLSGQVLQLNWAKEEMKLVIG